ncbi:MAG: RsmB/NOP family class I SAM-dependent RNA methyltransferase [Lachnospiraceae bacterium]|nr:RsmB/NOP family class I SAM-dependent RNA methyltransferase [Lachnospiraceae bacterium]
MNLPSAFTKQMAALLGAEYQDFLNCYTREKKQGLRVNTAKISVEEFLALTPFRLSPVPWTDNGFYYQEADKVTKHPHYYAGLYYIQEPSAMVPASRLPIKPGERVLDLCAAPGGKSTELSARLKGSGILVSNDVSVSRARALLKNMELFGIPNSFVTGETPEKLMQYFNGYFDKILVDAPCSGEGMFRKDPGLIKSWEERGPEYYAPIQSKILSCALSMLKPGGELLYSTCTFSPEENEAVLNEVLREYPQIHLITPKRYEGFAGGIFSSQWENLDVEKCVRIWPHKMEGEGHFTALMKKDVLEKTQEPDQTKAEKKTALWGRIPKEAEAFLRMLDFPLFQSGSLVQKQDNLFWLPEQGQNMPKLRYLRTGLLLGILKKERFEPSQPLAMALTKDSFPNVVDLPWDHPGILRYLKGETLDLEETDRCRNGWILVCCDGYPLGWGKCINGTLKNKYYPGWRMQ